MYVCVCVFPSCVFSSFLFSHPSREHARERTSLISIAWETFNMQFLFDISHLVLIRMNASPYKERHLHTYAFLPVDSSKSRNLFFFFFTARETAFLVPNTRWFNPVLPLDFPRYTSELVKQKRGKRGAQGNGNDDNDTIGLFGHSLWEKRGKASDGWFQMNLRDAFWACIPE